jgi:hypothetical protein
VSLNATRDAADMTDDRLPDDDIARIAGFRGAS